MTKTLIVTVEASTETALEDLIETLARVACDVSNSFEDENAHIFISEAATGLGAR
jgi:phenylpyruvate tautomerase PptA (4-oxalocrotonate tautomerase family)